MILTELKTFWTLGLFWSFYGCACAVFESVVLEPPFLSSTYLENNGKKYLKMNYISPSVCRPKKKIEK